MNLRYSFCPQMRVYDQLTEEYLPHIMYTQTRNFRSEVCNTDFNGLRFNEGNNLNKSLSIFDKTKSSDLKEGLIIGGSTAFGVGTSQDKHTLSSLLSKKNNYCFHNLGGRAYNGFQELILYQSLIEKVDKIKKIIIFSGLNDLYLLNHVNFQNNIGPIFFNKRFFEALKYSEIGIIRKFLHLYLSPFFLKDIDWSNITKKDLYKYLTNKKFRSDYKLRIQNFEKKISLDGVILRNLKLWNIITKNQNIYIYYFLQPYFFWCKEASKEEEKLMNYYKKHEVYWNAHDIINDSYIKYKKKIENYCNNFSIKFFDCNEYFLENINKNEWLFIDRAHLNDNGYSIIANYIKSKVCITS